MRQRVFLIGLLISMLASGCARSATRTTTQPIASPEAAEAAPVAWCHTLPVEKSFCRALVIEAPRAMLRLAVAETDQRRERGLMGLSALPPDEGMLFVFPFSSDRHLEFWMKDTLVPLDMVFVRADGTISKIAAGVPATKPGTADAAIARRAGIGVYVIELRAGGASAAGLGPGGRISIPAVEAQ